MTEQEEMKEQKETKKDTVKAVKQKVTNVHRRVARFLAATLILIISIGTPVILVMAVIETFRTANAAIEAVEPYCSARYQADVEAYKTCVKMPANKILEDITAEIKSATNKEPVNSGK